MGTCVGGARASPAKVAVDRLMQRRCVSTGGKNSDDFESCCGAALVYLGWTKRWIHLL